MVKQIAIVALKIVVGIVLVKLVIIPVALLVGTFPLGGWTK